MPILKHKSLSAQNHVLAKSNKQIDVLSNADVKPFSKALSENDLFPLKPIGVDVFQINLGKMCNQVCNHCHVDAGPDRKEIMTNFVWTQWIKQIVRQLI